MHDPDDIGAIPMSVATMCYAGFKDKIVHFDYANQNTRDGFCSPVENWAWMNDERAPEDWKWLYSRNRTASVNVGMFDMSDGGMTYWLISGATNGGNEKGNWDDIRVVFEKKFRK